MPDTPCTRCNGSGTEPDPISLAWQALSDLIEGDGSTASLRHSAGAYRQAWETRQQELRDRAFWLQTALRDILQRFPPTETGTATTTQPRPSTWHDVRNWRAILGDDGMTHRHWSFWDTDHIGALTCSCGTRWRPGSGPSTEPTCQGGC